MKEGFLGLGPGHWVVGLLLWCGLILAFVFMYLLIKKRERHEGKSNVEDKSSRSILEQRYARGEISAEEFAEKKNKLEH